MNRQRRRPSAPDAARTLPSLSAFCASLPASPTPRALPDLADATDLYSVLYALVRAGRTAEPRFAPAASCYYFVTSRTGAPAPISEPCDLGGGFSVCPVLLKPPGVPAVPHETLVTGGNLPVSPQQKTLGERSDAAGPSGMAPAGGYGNAPCSAQQRVHPWDKNVDVTLVTQQARAAPDGGTGAEEQQRETGETETEAVMGVVDAGSGARSQDVSLSGRRTQGERALEAESVLVAQALRESEEEGSRGVPGAVVVSGVGDEASRQNTATNPTLLPSTLPRGAAECPTQCPAKHGVESGEYIPEIPARDPEIQSFRGEGAVENSITEMVVPVSTACVALTPARLHALAGELASPGGSVVLAFADGDGTVAFHRMYAALIPPEEAPEVADAEGETRGQIGRPAKRARPSKGPLPPPPGE